MERKKAFVGAAIGAVTSIASGIINRNAQKKAQRKQNELRNRQDTLQQAANLTSSYADDSYVNEFQDRIAFSCGGRKKRNCGGKIKKEDGGIFKNINWNDAISAGIEGVGNIINTYQNRPILRCGGRKSR